MIRKCIVCGKEFETKVSSKKACSEECSKIRKREVEKVYRIAHPRGRPPIKCAFCGKEFVPTKNTSKYCSPACRKGYFNKVSREWYQKNRAKKGNPTTAICPQCGKTFERTNLNQKYCSVECKSLRWGHGGKIRMCKCVECGKEFESDYEEKYCSAKCRNAVKKRERAAEAMAKATNQPVKTLADWEREAAECNLDYGTYRALIQAGKTFEELKAQREYRQVPCHSHTTRASHEASWSDYINHL